MGVRFCFTGFTPVDTLHSADRIGLKQNGLGSTSQTNRLRAFLLHSAQFGRAVRLGRGVSIMEGYTKLFGSIVASTIWREDNATRIVWITMLAISNRHGIVEASVPGLADLARLGVDETRAALAKLLSPDPDSRTKAHEGRRILEVDGGWLIINRAKYKQKMADDDRREYLRVKQQEQRDKRVNNRQQSSTESTQHSIAEQSRAKEDGTPLPPKPENNGNSIEAVVRLVRKVGSAGWKRPENRQPSYAEERAALEVLRRPDWEAEMKTIVAFLKSVTKQDRPFYVPFTLLKLLDDWSGALDKAAMYDPHRDAPAENMI